LLTIDSEAVSCVFKSHVILLAEVNMTVDKIDVSAALAEAKKSLEEDKNISASTAAVFKLLITIVTILLNQKNINSRNSSKPPSQDPNRPRKTRRDKGGKRKPGGQKGHPGSTLSPIEKPDEVEEILIDRRTLPLGDYTSIGFEKRQVFDFEIKSHVVEYQGEVLEDQNGDQWVAHFPDGVDNPAQYSGSLKSHSVYMSQFQLIPQLRVADYFNDQLGIPLSKGSVQKFNQAAYKGLEKFEDWAKEILLISPVNNADETGVNVNGKRLWFHLLSNSQVALYQVDEKRGQEAMDRMGILPIYSGVGCPDHWKPY
jgi:transposase